MSLFGFKLGTRDRLGSLETLCAALARSVVQTVPPQAQGLAASFAAVGANVLRPLQKYRHPRANRDAP